MKTQEYWQRELDECKRLLELTTVGSRVYKAIVNELTHCSVELEDATGYRCNQCGCKIKATQVNKDFCDARCEYEYNSRMKKWKIEGGVRYYFGTEHSFTIECEAKTEEEARKIAHKRYYEYFKERMNNQADKIIINSITEQ